MDACWEWCNLSPAIQKGSDYMYFILYHFTHSVCVVLPCFTPRLVSSLALGCFDFVSSSVSDTGTHKYSQQGFSWRLILTAVLAAQPSSQALDFLTCWEEKRVGSHLNNAKIYNNCDFKCRKRGHPQGPSALVFALLWETAKSQNRAFSNVPFLLVYTEAQG